MNEAIERDDSEYAKWIAGQTFEGCVDTVPLDSMPNNADDASRGMNAGIWMRACAVILQDDDEQLYKKFKDDESAEFWLDFADDLQKFIDSEKAGIEIFEACHMRLLVCAHRYQEENFPEGDGD